MANIKSAKKRAKQGITKRKRNVTRMTALKTAVKKVVIAAEQNTDAANTVVLLRDAEAKIARAQGKGLLHKNTAARKISKLAKKVAAASRPENKAAASKPATKAVSKPATKAKAKGKTASKK